MYDLMVLGSGPGGYAGAIRAAQLGLKVAVVERAELGGVCLNWGCIPTKALLKSASVYAYAVHADQYGVEVSGVVPKIEQMVERSRGVAAQMSKGIEFLLKKHNVEVIAGFGQIADKGVVEVEGVRYETRHIVVATGARPRVVPAIPVDGKYVVTSKEALVLDRLPATMIVVGSGAIGLEFASFFGTLGSKITVVEYLDRIAPLEDAEISATLERALRKAKMTVMTATGVQSVRVEGEQCVVEVEGKKGAQTLRADVVLSAVGVQANIEGIGLEAVGVAVERGKIVVDERYRTSVEGIYAIGDVIATPALAHVATAEAVRCVEWIAGMEPTPIDYRAIPSCIYTTPEVSSVGLTEAQAVAAGHEVRIGKFPFTASGKATAAGMRDGLVKLVFDAQTDKLLGAHMVGGAVTEMVAEPTLALALGATAKELIAMIHPHPTLSEGVMEAAAAAHGEAIHVS